jgi:hypothetical protein
MSTRQSTTTRRTSPIATWAERRRRAAALRYRPWVRDPGLDAADVGAAARGAEAARDEDAAMRVESRPPGRRAPAQQSADAPGRRRQNGSEVAPVARRRASAGRANASSIAALKRIEESVHAPRYGTAKKFGGTENGVANW